MKKTKKFIGFTGHVNEKNDKKINHFVLEQREFEIMFEKIIPSGFGLRNVNNGLYQEIIRRAKKFGYIIENRIMFNKEKSDQRMNKLRKAATPLLKLLNTEYHPHVTVIITATSIELVEGMISIPNITEYIVD